MVKAEQDKSKKKMSQGCIVNRGKNRHEENKKDLVFVTGDTRKM